jgi:hypothetical protein
MRRVVTLLPIAGWSRESLGRQKGALGPGCTRVEAEDGRGATGVYLELVVENLVD